MDNRHRKLLIGVAAVAVLASGGVTIANATSNEREQPDKPLDPAVAAKARTALQKTRGGKVGQVEAEDEGNAAYSVAVTKADGSTVDVQLDKSMAVVGVEATDGDERQGD